MRKRKTWEQNETSAEGGRGPGWRHLKIENKRNTQANTQIKTDTYIVK